MHVFVTGATGFVGSEVTRQLIAAGHRVTGLTRSEKSAEALERAGGMPLRGELTDLDILSRGAREADATIHTAFIHDFANFANSLEVERKVIGNFGNALEGSGKPFLMTSGIGLLSQGRVVTEEDAAATSGHASVRGSIETLALTFADRGIRVGAVRLPPSTHGNHDHGFVPILIDMARKQGKSAYIGEGQNKWPAVHVRDAARVYLLALEKGQSGDRYHPVGDAGIPFKAIAEKIGENLGVPVVSVPKDKAQEHFGWFAGFAQFDVPASHEITSRKLDWQPKEIGLLEDMETGTYFR
jgi:nucleoside-diphosphate-sugar epimerase